MKILALDLGKSKTVDCFLDTSTGETAYGSGRTDPGYFESVIARYSPDVVTFEVGSNAGWVHDTVSPLVNEVLVANPTHQGLQWRRQKSKSDRVDALKLAQLAAIRQIPTVHIPCAAVRHRRSLIEYRMTLVGRCTQIRNNIRAMLDRIQRKLPNGKRGWTCESIEFLETLAQDESINAMWRSQLSTELSLLQTLTVERKKIEQQLNTHNATCSHVQRLMTIPGVGPRTAEVIVAMIDDPHRFRSGKQVGSYAGLVPRQIQSGNMDLQGRITRQGNRLLRALLVQSSWIGLRHNPWMQTAFKRIQRGSKSRSKIAIVAVARKLLVRCWAMLRDGKDWNELSIAKEAA